MRNESARLPEKKIEVSCECGKRYRASAAKAGTRIRCKECGGRIRIPRFSGISERSRDGILAELGIDSDVARAKYREEKLKETPQPKVYKCIRCEAKIRASELKGAYVRGELLCKACRDAALVTERRAADEKEVDERERSLAESRVESRERQRREATFWALAYGAFFFTGVFAPAWIVFSVSFTAAGAMGLGFALLGGLAVYATRRGAAFL
ncbi:hypothetical protein HY251_01530 [bacterium]|nr:hypothetical protein [bacterium]